MLRSARLTLLFLVAPAAAQVTFDEHVLPVFEQSCLNCHNPDKAKGGLDLSTYQSTLKGGSGGRIVEAGDPSSRLLGVVLRTAEPAMPPEGDAISKEHRGIIRKWIEGGLRQNPGSKARQPDKPKFDTRPQGNPLQRPPGPPPMPRDLRLEPAVVAERPSAIHAMATSPWAPLLAVTAPFQVLLYDTRSFELAGILPFPEGEPMSLAFTPDGRHLIVGGGRQGKSGLTVTYHVISGERALTAAREFDTILCADLRPDLAAVATGSPSQLIKLWNSSDGAQATSIKKHTDWVTALDYSPDGILLATGDRNGGVWVWEALTGAEFHTLRGHQAGITAATFRSDSNLLATASEDGSVRFWEMAGGKEVKNLNAHPPGVLAFAWAPDGGCATAGRDRQVRLWKSDFTPRHTIKGLSEIPTAIAIDDTHVFIADYQGRIHIHRIEDGKAVVSIDNNPPRVATRLHRIASKLASCKPGDRAALLQQRRHWHRALLHLGSFELEQQARRAETDAEQAALDLGEAAAAMAGRSRELATLHAQRRDLRSLPRPHEPARRRQQQAELHRLNQRSATLRQELEEDEARIEACRQAHRRIQSKIGEHLRQADQVRELYHGTGGTGS